MAAISGIILFFIVVHLGHFTVGLIQPENFHFQEMLQGNVWARVPQAHTEVPQETSRRSYVCPGLSRSHTDSICSGKSQTHAAPGDPLRFICIGKHDSHLGLNRCPEAVPQLVNAHTLFEQRLGRLGET